MVAIGTEPLCGGIGLRDVGVGRGAVVVSGGLRGMQILADEGLGYSVICVITPETIDHAEALVDFFTGLPGCESVGFNIEEHFGAPD
nr:hypothetical protein [Micromonospora sp. CB01531]